MKLDGISQYPTPAAAGRPKTHRNDDFAARLAQFDAPGSPLESRSPRPNGGIVFGGEGPLRAGADLSAYQDHLQKAVELEKKLGTGIPVLSVEDTGSGTQRLRESGQSASELVTNTMLLMQMLDKDGNYQDMVARNEGPKQAVDMPAPAV